MPGNMGKLEDGAHNCFYTERRRAIHEALQFSSLPTVSQNWLAL